MTTKKTKGRSGAIEELIKREKENVPEAGRKDMQEYVDFLTGEDEDGE